ncbi:MAG: ABC transporter substrate-binding protein [Streptosporangiales bacterium]|nr:ABC transporter substrate-binding protein [Streptosporangiales bacterium]
MTAASDTVRAALVTPLSGPLAGFGRVGVHALELWARSAAELPRPFRGVELTVHDSSPDAAAAVRAALTTRPHLLFGPYGGGPALAVARNTDRLVWNHGGATGKLAGYPHVVNVLAPASSYHVGALELLVRRDPRPAAGTVLYVDTGFGRDVAEGAADAAARLGVAVRRLGFPRDTAAEAAASVPDADVLLVAAGFADELTMARELLSRPWRAAAFVGAGEEAPLAELGEAREGLLGPAQWMPAAAPEPDEGPDAAWFVRAYQEIAGGPPPYPATQAFAAGLLAARCLRDAGEADDDALRRAARSLSCTTLYGRFRLDDEGRQVGHRVLTVQWQAGHRRIVWPPGVAEVTAIYPRT